MEGVQYVGEWLWPSKLGHAAVVLGFVTAALAAFAYFKSTQLREQSDVSAQWKRLGRWAFIVHGASIFAVIGTIFTIMLQHRFEYQYAQQHVSDDLAFEYIFAAFWEGQEGSFLLWMFWHIILGVGLLLTAKRWEAPTLSVLSAVQMVLVSMILGQYWGIGEYVYKIGSSPLMLLRDIMDIPIFQQADYVSKLKGNGLNPLLQNYWMTIHPPTLFLGFASTTIPFCFAIAGLWTREHKAWLQAALPWALFSGAILGLGILMGGAWAYEALSFGGYWAWDPVENMSLVPWLILIAGIHAHLVARATGHSVRATYMLYILTFVGVVYSTFLTRSGVLGDTSVHAFTDLGLGYQLVAFLGIFTLGGFGMLIARYKGIPAPEKEEAISSREFWMFIGTLVLFFSAILITFTTSIPVYNKLFDAFGRLLGQDFTSWHRTAPVDAVAHYNKYQLWIGVFIGLLSGVAQNLRYKEMSFASRARKFLIHLSIAAAITAVLTFLNALWIDIPAWYFTLLLFSGIFAIVSNLQYFLTLSGRNMKMAGSILSHVGFGIMIVGIMASGLNKQHISNNLFAQEGLIEGFTADDYKKNILLMKDAPMIMSGYEVTYLGDTMSGFTRTFNVKYAKLDASGKPTDNVFYLKPNVLLDKTMTKVAASNPATQRYLSHDLFTHVSSLPRADMDRTFAQSLEDSLDYQAFEAAVGDTFIVNPYYGVVTSATRTPSANGYKSEAGDKALGLHVEFHKLGVDSVWHADPVVVWRHDAVYYYPAQVSGLDMRVRIGEPALRMGYPTLQDMDLHPLVMQLGQAVKHEGKTVVVQRIERSPTHPDYEAIAGDVVVGADVQITDAQGKVSKAMPIFLIRDNMPSSLPAYLDNGDVLLFSKIDPESGEFTIEYGSPKAGNAYTLEVADKAARNDYIVMEAILFPGINLFWLGSLMMLFGLGYSWIRRRNMVVEG